MFNLKFFIPLPMSEKRIGANNFLNSNHSFLESVEIGVAGIPGKLALVASPWKLAVFDELNGKISEDHDM